MRHEKPQRMIDYEQTPKFCHTCVNYNQKGICEIHDKEPPEDFAKTENACDRWVYDIPF